MVQHLGINTHPNASQSAVICFVRRSLMLTSVVNKSTFSYAKLAAEILQLLMSNNMFPRGVLAPPLSRGTMLIASLLIFMATLSCCWLISRQYMPIARDSPQQSRNLASSIVISNWYKSDAQSYASWEGIAVDSTGQYGFAVSGGPYNQIFKSINFGRNWTVVSSAPIADWEGITVDSAGVNLAAAEYGGLVYISRDSGGTWAPSDAPASQWEDITSDATGQFLVAVHSSDGSNSGIAFSDDYGASWAPGSPPPFQDWRSVASDSTGQFVYAGATNNGIIAASSNYGLNWTTTAAPPHSWTALATDSTGQYVYAVANAVGIYTSNDSAVTWHRSSAPAFNWYSIASDATGRYLVAVSMYPSGSIYNSNDFGVTWYCSNSADAYWRSVTSDSSGQYLTVGSEIYEGIYSTDGVGSTFFPTASPTDPPSHQPTSQPSAQPSSQPSTYPTYVADTFETTVTVMAQTPAGRATISHLGHGTPVYVTANLLFSYLSVASGGFVTITAGSGGSMVYVSQQCAPTVACATGSALTSTYCAVNVDVTSALSSQSGGTLELNVVTNTLDVSGTTPELCSQHGVQGIYFEVNFTVSAFRQPTFAPTPSPTIQPTQSNGDELNDSESALVTSGGAPFYVIGVAMAAFAALGVLVVRLHDSAKGLTPLRLLAVCFDLALQGNIIVSEIFYITVLLQSSGTLFEALAIVLIFARMQNAVCGSYLLYRLYTPSTLLYEKLNKEVLLLNSKLHSAVQILMMFDCAMFRYLPWMASDVTFQSMQFPDAASFKLCMATRVLQSGTALVVQIVVLARLSRSNLQDPYTLGLLTLILIMTAAVFVSILITIGMHLREMRSPPGQSVDGTSARSGNPLHAMELAQLGAAGADAGTGGAAGAWEERVALLEREVAELKDAQGRQQTDQAALRKEHDEKLLELGQQLAALRTAVVAKAAR